MKSYLRLCEECDLLPEYPPSCYKLLVEGKPGVFGHLIEPTVRSFSWTENFIVDHDRRTVKVLGESCAVRSSHLEQLLISAKKNGTFKVLTRWYNEPFPVYGPDREVVLSMDRCAVPLFGVPSHAAFLIIYREDEAGISIWVARRAPTKWLYPNKIGCTVAGGIPTGETPGDCVVREAYEEAALDEKFVRENVKAAGVVTYVTVTDSKSTSGGEAGLIVPEVQFQYEMKVGPDVVPKVHDMEASGFELLSIDELKKAIEEGDSTPGNACFFLDFFIRHGIVTFENEVNYTKIVSRLHRPIGVHAA